jgi:DNA-directed RNA polymerase specialized sigma24 family protein
MERERVKKILLFCRDIDGEIKLRRRILQDYESAYYTSGGGGGMIDGMPRSKYRAGNPTETAAINIPGAISAAMHGLRATIEELADAKAEILKELEKLPLAQKSVLYDFYVLGKQWGQIAARVNYGATQCKKIRNRALDNLGGRFEKNDRIKNLSPN